MTTFRAVLLLFAVAVAPPAAGIAGFRLGAALGSGTTAALVSVIAFLVGCIPVVVLWRRTPRTGYPMHDDGDAGFWTSGGASGGSAERIDSVDFSGDSGGGDGGGGDGGGGD